MTIGETLRTLRKEKNITREQMSKDTGLSVIAIGHYERNEREPNFEAMSKLEKYFGVSARYLRGETDIKTVSEEMFFEETLKVDEKLKDKPRNIQRMVISILNGFNSIVEKLVNNTNEKYSPKDLKKFSMLRSIVDKINSVYFSSFLPTKELWINGPLSELEFYRRNEAEFKKHLNAVEYYLNEVFSLHCSELYKEYLLDFDKMTTEDIEMKDSTSREIAANETHYYPVYFKNFEKDASADQEYTQPLKSNIYRIEETEVVYLPILGDAAAGKPIEIIQLPQGQVPVDAKYGRYNSFLVRAKGDSMVEAGINDGDLVVVKPQPIVENAEIAVINIDGESTIKYFHMINGHYELRPANSKYETMIYEAGSNISVIGKVVDIIRKEDAQLKLTE